MKYDIKIVELKYQASKLDSSLSQRKHLFMIFSYQFYYEDQQMKLRAAIASLNYSILESHQDALKLYAFMVKIKLKVRENSWGPKRNELKRTSFLFPCIHQLNIINFMKAIIFIRILVLLYAVEGYRNQTECLEVCNSCSLYFVRDILCTACSEDMRLTTMNECSMESTLIPYCQYYENSTWCSRCEVTYSRSNGKCQKDNSGCLERDHSLTCVRCGFGTILSDEQCVGSINCASAVNPCPECIAGFSLVNGICFDNTGNCKNKGKNGFCVTCKENFKLVGYRCLPKALKVYQCFIYDDDGNCFSCKSGYKLYEANCLLPSEIQQAIKEKSSSNDSTIANSKSWTAIKVRYDRDLVGYGNYIKVASNCKKQEDPKQEGSCAICNSGFELFYGACKQMSSFCLRRYQNSSCIRCKYGLLLIQGQCRDPNCAEQTDYACLVCNPNFAINFKKYCEYSDTNCLQPTSTHCNKCAVSFFLNAKGFCLRMPNNCLEVDARSQACTKCTPGFKVNKQKQCEQYVNHLVPNCAVQNDNECMACLPKFYLNRNQNTCLKDLNFGNCRRGRLNTGDCQVCRSGYTLLNGGCIQSDPPQFCLTYNQKAGVCTACTSGYILEYVYTSQRGTFICSKSPLALPFPPIPHCASYNGFVCAVCLDSYYPSKGICLPPNPLCQTSGSDGRCHTCFPGYLLRRGNCQYPQSALRNCQAYDAEGYCTVCEENYFLNENRNCQRRDQACKYYTNGICSQCNRYFFLLKGRCLPFQPILDINCLELDWEKKACKECLNGLTPNGLKCE